MKKNGRWPLSPSMTLVAFKGCNYNLTTIIFNNKSHTIILDDRSIYPLEDGITYT